MNKNQLDRNGGDDPFHRMLNCWRTDLCSFRGPGLDLDLDLDLGVVQKTCELYWDQFVSCQMLRQSGGRLVYSRTKTPVNTPTASSSSVTPVLVMWRFILAGRDLMWPLSRTRVRVWGGWVFKCQDGQNKLTWTHLLQAAQRGVPCWCDVGVKG